jgi:hypothetical protein
MNQSDRNSRVRKRRQWAQSTTIGTSIAERSLQTAIVSCIDSYLCLFNLIPFFCTQIAFPFTLSQPRQLVCFWTF